MTEQVNITIQEGTLPLVIDTGTPAITITDNQDSITVIEASPVQIVPAEENPRLIINNGGYVGTVSVLLKDLLGKLTRNQMSPGLASDLERLESLWTRVGNEILLTYPDGVSIQEAGRSYTDNSITDAVADITTTTDGKIDAAYSVINQNAEAITQTVTALEGSVNDRFTVNESLINQTAESVTSVVTRMDTIDGPGGSVELLQSSIDQNASSISAEVTARELLGDNLTTATTSISLLSDSLTLASETISSLDSRITSSELILGEDGINLSVLQEALSDHEYSIGTFQNVLTNQWSVTIEEDVSGNKYAAGFGVLVHPLWLEDTVYAVDETVYYGDTVYQCILAHTADATNSPGSTETATYWLELTDGVKSDFTVQADAFNILTSDGLTPVFTVTEGKATLNTALSVVSLESSNYGTEGESWFKLDPDTGLAEFNNMVAVFGSGSSGYANITDAPQGVADGATNDTDLRYSGDTTLIDGNKIFTAYLSSIQALLGNVTIDSSGSLKSSGKDSYTSTVSGYYFGFYGGLPVINIGNATQYFKYYNGLVSIGGDIVATGNIKANNITKTYSASASNSVALSGDGESYAILVLTCPFVASGRPAVFSGTINIANYHGSDGTSVCMKVLVGTSERWRTTDIRLLDVQGSGTATTSQCAMSFNFKYTPASGQNYIYVYAWPSRQLDGYIKVEDRGVFVIDQMTETA